VIVLSIVGALGVSACSTDSPTPATAPATTATTVLETSTTTTTEAPATTTSTTAAPPTTVNRKAEIEAIFQDLEQRRLTALYEGDEEAFRALFANEAYLETDLESFSLAAFSGAPAAVVTVIRVRADTVECLASTISLERLDLEQHTEPHTVVLRPTELGWGYAYVFEGEDGWLCDGPHPLQS